MNRQVDLGAFLAACIAAIVVMTASGIIVAQTMNEIVALRTACYAPNAATASEVR